MSFDQPMLAELNRTFGRDCSDELIEISIHEMLEAMATLKWWQTSFRYWGWEKISQQEGFCSPLSSQQC